MRRGMRGAINQLEIETYLHHVGRLRLTRVDSGRNHNRRFLHIIHVKHYKLTSFRIIFFHYFQHHGKWCGINNALVLTHNMRKDFQV